MDQAPLSMGFSRQEYWSGLPFPSPGDLFNPGIEPRSPTLQADALSSEPPGKPGLREPGMKPTSLMSPALAGGFFTTSANWEALCLLYLKIKITTHFPLYFQFYLINK